MNLEIAKDPVRKPRSGETAGDARYGAHMWTENAKRENYGDEEVTPESVQIMKEDLDDIRHEIAVLIDRSKKIRAIIESDPDEQSKAQYTQEKMKLGVELEELDTEEKALAKKLKSAEETLNLKAGGMPPLEFTEPTKH
jgi:predicted RNase H-like nuclease (RuvC/YqgF family)